MHLPKFEQISALKHHCGVCKSPFSNPNSLSTCIGKHEVICANYHFMFHFIGKAHTCKACINTEQQQEKRHRAILALLHDYRKENGQADIDEIEPTLPSITSPYLEGLRKKDRKALKKAAKNFIKLDIIKQTDLAKLYEIIYTRDNNTEDADKALANALSVKFMPSVFTEQHMLDTLMAPPKQRPNLDDEAARVITNCNLQEPQSRPARAILEKIRSAIKDDIEIQWKTDLEMKKRRIIYAQWITQGALDNMALHYEDWDINTGARTNRRYKGDEKIARFQGRGNAFDEDLSEDRDELEDDTSDLTVLTRWSSLNSISSFEAPSRQNSLAYLEPKSPLNDRRRGGSALQSPLHPITPPPTVLYQLGEGEKYTAAPRALAPPTLRILAQSTNTKPNPWIPQSKPKPLDLAAKTLSGTPIYPQSLMLSRKLDLSFSSPLAGREPRDPWRRNSSSPTPVSNHGGVISPPTTDSAVDDMIESSPRPKMVSIPRMPPKKILVDHFVDDAGGEWATVGKKGKITRVSGGNRK